MNYVITIGREYGSGGRHIGKAIAKKLGINFYDSALLDKVAENSGLSLDYIKSNDEKKDSLFSFFGLGNNALVSTASQTVLQAQFNTIEHIYETESAVIVGRCSNYILRYKKNVVNIFIHASLPTRIKRCVEEYHLDEKEVPSIIEKIDKRRASYYNYFTDQKWGNSTNYDLTISTDLGADKATDIIISFIKDKLGI